MACNVTLVQVLLVEDDARLGPLVKRALETDGHAVVLARSAAEALGVDVSEVEVAVIDWMLPDGDGLTVASVLGSRGFHAPVLVLTARSETRERVHALDTVADDYLTKPFAMDELLARVRALGRRGRRPEVVSAGDLQIDVVRRTAFVSGVLLPPLTAKELSLLLYFARRPDTIVTREELVGAVWDGEVGPSNLVQVAVSRLRDKLGPHARLLETVRGEGYRLRTSAP